MNGWILTEGEERDLDEVVGRTREGLVLEEEAEMGLLPLLEEPTEPFDPTEGGRVLMAWEGAVMRGDGGDQEEISWGISEKERTAWKVSPR